MLKPVKNMERTSKASHLPTTGKSKTSDTMSQPSGHQAPLGIDFALIFIVLMYIVSIFLQGFSNA